MTVGIDLRCLPQDGSAGAGVAHAARFLTEALLRQHVAWEWKIYLPQGASFVCHPRAGRDLSGIEQDSLLRGNDSTEAERTIILSGASGSSLRNALRASPCDVLFVPGGSVPPRLPVPAIPWVHDVTIFGHPDWFPQSWLKRQLTTTLFRRGVKRAPLVFAVSEDTKNILVSLLQLDPARVIVTHEGGDSILRGLEGDALEQAKIMAKHRLAERGITQRFVLFLGTIEPRKNISMLIEAWKKATPSFTAPVSLVIAGRDGWGNIQIPSDSGIVRLRECNDDLRRDLLLAAEIVALPSFHEGFGLVALEAMQARTALIASNTGAIPEVVGDGGVLLDPREVEAWSKMMIELMKDDKKRFLLAKEGKKRSNQFHWDRTAEAICQKVS